MSIADAETGDIYVDKLGKLWRVVGVCREPTVTVEEVEGHLPTSPNLMQGAAAQAFIATAPAAPQIIRARQSGGIGGLMWDGFKRIWRRETAA